MRDVAAVGACRSAGKNAHAGRAQAFLRAGTQHLEESGRQAWLAGVCDADSFLTTPGRARIQRVKKPSVRVRRVEELICRLRVRWVKPVVGEGRTLR
jgi:hypothetical protein